MASEDPEPSETEANGRDESVMLLASPPVLGTLAAVAALLDLAWTNGAVRALSERLDHATLLSLVRWGAVLKNLAGIAGAVALAAALTAFLRAPRSGRVVRAIGLAGFGGIFLPIVAVATFTPIETLADKWRSLVFFAVGAAHFLAILMAIAAARRSGPLGLRAATTLFGIAAFLSFAWMALSRVPIFAESVGGATILLAIQRAGEMAWIPIPLLCASAILPRPGASRGHVALTVALGTGAATAALLLVARGEVRADFPHFVYGLVRTESLIDTLPELYVVTIAAAIGIGAGALCASEPARVQAGGALFLLVAAGYAPRSPLRLLAFVLAAAMLARATIALGDRVSAKRGIEQRPAVEPDASPTRAVPSSTSGVE